MSPAGSVRIWWDASVQAYRLTSPFNKDLVDAIKTHVPVSGRSYDPPAKMWTFTEQYLTPLMNLFKVMGVSPTVLTRQQVEAAQQSSPDGAQRGKPLPDLAVEFLRNCGLDAAQKAYRYAAMLNHPDRGGDMQKMSALNAAWDRIQKELFNA